MTQQQFSVPAAQDWQSLNYEIQLYYGLRCTPLLKTTITVIAVCSLLPLVCRYPMY